MLRCKKALDIFVQCNIFPMPSADRPEGPRRLWHVSRGGPSGRKGTPMVKNLEEMQKLGKDNMDVTLKAFGAVSKGFQAIAVEMADYAKKTFEEGTAASEKLIGAKSLDKAFEVHSDYVKAAYEGFVSQ